MLEEIHEQNNFVGIIQQLEQKKLEYLLESIV